MKKILLFALIFNIFALSAYQLSYKETHLSDKKTKISLTITLESHEVVYEKELLCSIDSPSITLTEWKTSEKIAATFDPYFKEHRMVFDESFTIEMEAERDDSHDVQQALLHVIIASNKQKTPQESLFPVTFLAPDQNAELAQDAVAVNDQMLNDKESTEKEEVKHQTWTAWIQNIKKNITDTESYPLRLFFAFLLGILLSLTPCIYPMIPITVGILQSQGTSSLMRNFLLSLCYATGLGTTFALMGLLAASSGQAFGYLMANPLFVCAIVALLCYFAFSLFGFYNLYIPRFLQNTKTISKSGSAVSIFLFGLASGTFASPCLSPGLALILALVATMAHKLLGLLLLFAFGVGLSVPLIIIGTFSSSLSLLPRAGMWMIEIQKVFGFLLLGMCLYYLSAILPAYAIFIGLFLFFFFIGAYYVHKSSQSMVWSIIKNIFGSLCIIVAIFFAIQALQEFYYKDTTPLAHLAWKTDWKESLQEAITQNKKILIDFSTPYCSICSAITKTVLQDEQISKILEKDYILLAVDASDKNTEPYKTLKAMYDVQGVPTLVIIDPSTKKEEKRWMSELYGMKKTIVMQELKKYAFNLPR